MNRTYRITLNSERYPSSAVEPAHLAAMGAYLTAIAGSIQTMPLKEGPSMYGPGSRTETVSVTIGSLSATIEVVETVEAAEQST